MEEINFNSLEFNLYELLNLPFDCTIDDVKKKFRKLVKKFHPDKMTDIEEKLYYNITLANHILSNPELKNKYNNWLLNSHKSHSALKDNFKDELQNIKQYFPQTKEEAIYEFEKNSNILAQRHGNYMEDTRGLNAIYKDKERERNNVNIIKEDYSNMDEFNQRFTERKKNGIYCDKIVKRNADIQPYTFGSNKYAELKDFHNMYRKDSQIKYAFELMPVDETLIDSKNISQRLDDYNKETNRMRQNKNKFNDLDF